MSVLSALAKEHLLFNRLMDALKRSLGYEEATARLEIRNTLLVLLPALDKHEEIENVVFGNPNYRSRRGTEDILTKIHLQHKKIEDLHEEITRTLRGSQDYPLSYLKPLIESLIEKLQAHFQSEETELWPHYREWNRSTPAAIERRTEERVRTLEREMNETREIIEDYLGRKR